MSKKETKKKMLPAGASYSQLLWALYLSTFLIRFSFSVMIMVFPPYLKKEGIGDVAYGFVWAASPAAEFFTVLLLGGMIDRYGRKPVLLSGLLLGTIAMYLMASTTHPLVIGILNAFHGVSAGAILASSLALMADYAPKDIRGQEMGMFDGANMSGWGAGFLLGGLVNEKLALDLYWGFIVAGTLGTVGLVLVYFIVHEPRVKAFTINELSARHIISVLKRSEVLLLMMPWLMIYIMIGAGLAFAGLEGSTYSIPPWLVGTAMALLCICLVSTQRFFGRMSDKYGRVPLMFIGASGFLGLVVGGISVYLTGVPTGDEILGNLPKWGPFLGLMGLFGAMAFAFAPAALASLGDVAKKKQHGVTMSVYSMVISAGMVIGVPTAGAVRAQWSTPGLLGFFSVIVGLMFFFVLLRRYQVHAAKKKQKEEEE
jgi:MFS family permease